MIDLLGKYESPQYTAQIYFNYLNCRKIIFSGSVSESSESEELKINQALNSYITVCTNR